MAKTVSEEEIQLRKRARRRLVGAITLVAAAVVILPMVLDSKPEQRNQEIDIRIPAEDSADEFVPGTAPRMEPPAPAVPQQSAPGVQQEERVESKPPVKPSQSRAEPAGKSVAAAAGRGVDSAPEAGSAKAAAADEFVVQLGAFSDPAKARQQQQSLISKDAKKVYTETLKVDKGEITRVRVGPFRTREEAEGARVKLKKLGFDGVVTDK